MQRNITVNLGNLVLSLSDAMDLASPLLIQHQQRTALVAWKMGKVANLSNERLEKIFIGALLHDIGAFSLEEKMAIISQLFRNIIDFRSHFTSTHSSGVAAASSLLARIFGLTDAEIGLIEVAGDLHDFGKLAIPNSILNKPGSLTKEEMSIMKCHTYYTYLVINSIGGLNQIAEWAAYHHERLDGSGYPFND